MSQERFDSLSARPGYSGPAAIEDRDGAGRRIGITLVALAVVLGATLGIVVSIGGADAGLDAVRDSDGTSNFLAFATIGLGLLLVTAIVLAIGFPDGVLRGVMLASIVVLLMITPVVGAAWALSAPEVFTPIHRWWNRLDDPDRKGQAVHQAPYAVPPPQGASVPLPFPGSGAPAERFTDPETVS